MISRLGVLGWPVSHSRSPAIHNAALAAVGLSDWRYQRLPVPPALFADTVGALRRLGLRRGKRHDPHKRGRAGAGGPHERRGRRDRRGHTLSFGADGAIAAENTDAPGLIAAIDEPLTGARALVLGAGGSARAAVWALREAGAVEVSIWNRTPQRASELADDLGARAVAHPEPADVLVNCTSVGLQPAREELASLALSPDALGAYDLVVDLVYRGGGTTELVRVARERGVRTLDGLEILVAQGALSFELWTGREAPREAMRRAARE